MSLARLLATGKSLVGTNSQTGRYQIRPQRLLPKFESAKNPFRAPAHPGPMETGAAMPQHQTEASVGRGGARETQNEPAPSSAVIPQSSVQDEPGKGGPQPAGSLDALDMPVSAPALLASADTSRKPKTVLGIRSSAERLQSPAEGARLAMPDSKRCNTRDRKPGRLSRLVRALFGWRPQRPHPVTLSRPRLPVQGELSLNAVKVVRNDLRDSDWELAPGKPAASKPAKAGREPESGPPGPPAKSTGPAARHAFDAGKT